ncbi:hypothetical protein NM208_g2170 [Fusarium decemcellulare]|uniref:Uncharacterized protein n=1 Tax=Fusarium decemcellulare TaxID=57161 RepID=A0ACC1STI5_9HYPO|nr:hypothetical protein NM208_g2170 [Fusarium decemcellulare]
MAEIADSWQLKAQISRDVLQDSIDKTCLLGVDELPGVEVRDVNKWLQFSGHLTPLEWEMTSQDIRGLLDRYKTGDWSVEQVTRAFLKRATIGHQILNYATEFLSETALGAARHLDDHFRQSGQLKGPLHGVPVSVKEHVAIGGRICHASFVSKIDNTAFEDAHIVKLLKKAGAVIHVRTNQPQSIMHLDCSNNITGTTLNPLDRRLSPGGSSGGEGAALSFGCSMLGVGTDIGGSVRVPAAFCGVYGFKPTSLRNPSFGLVGVMGGQESIRGCVGPLARNMKDLAIFEKAILDQKPWEFDTVLVPLPWRQPSLRLKDLTVGLMMDDGNVRLHPPIRLALMEAEKRLVSKSVKVVRWQLYKHAEGWDIVRQLYFPEGGQRVREAIAHSGEPMLPLTSWALSRATDKSLTIVENWSLNLRRDRLRREYHRAMAAQGVDVILCPVYHGVGAVLGETKYWQYTSIWNILDQPAVSFPIGHYANTSETCSTSKDNPLSAEDEAEQNNYDLEMHHGLPISLQLVGKRHQDEELLVAAGLVEEIISATS